MVEQARKFSRARMGEGRGCGAGGVKHEFALRAHPGADEEVRLG